jgi:hypothetical protein
MEDDFFEEDETIFGADEVFDCIVLEEMEKENSKKKNNAGCLSTVFMMISTFGFATSVFLMIIL